MDFGITGKRALILSAGGGLGSAIALALAREGVQVYLADRNGQALSAAKDRIEKDLGDSTLVKGTFVWDLAKQTEWHSGTQSVLESSGGIDILVNNTGGPPPGPAFGHDSQVWRDAFDSMVVSAIGITDMLLPGMRERKWGRVITSTSSGVISPIPNLGLSNATRISLVGWSKTLARDVAKDRVTVNVVVPGRISTARIQFLDTAKAQREGRDAASVELESAASIPLGRYGRPEEYAEVVAFIASERASYVTGSSIRVDGGLIANV